jgi:hypothetical protein
MKMLGSQPRIQRHDCSKILSLRLSAKPAGVPFGTEDLTPPQLIVIGSARGPGQEVGTTATDAICRTGLTSFPASRH